MALHRFCIACVLVLVCACSEKPFVEKSRTLPAELRPFSARISFVDGTPHDEPLSGPLALTFSAEKNIKSVEILTPGLKAHKDGNSWIIRIGTEFISHGLKMPQECTQSEASNQVCLCAKVTAEDDASAISNHCITKTKPLINFSSQNQELKNNSVIDTQSLKNLSMKVEAKSGFDIASCHAYFERIDGFKPRVIAKDPRVQQNICLIDTHFFMEDVEDGYYTLSAEVVDIAGQKNEEKIKLFITSKPADFSLNIAGATYIKTNSLFLQGKSLKFPERVTSVDAYVWFKGSMGEKEHFPLKLKDDTWSAQLNCFNQEGTFIIETIVVDDRGPHKLPLREVIVDRSAPMVFGHAEGVPQTTYLNANPLEQGDFPSSMETKPDWNSQPVLFRWAHLLYSNYGVPSYTIKIEDTSPISLQVGVATSCEQLPDLVDVPLASGLTEIVFTPKNVGYNLSQERGNRVLKLCMVIKDASGNVQNKSIAFKWHTVAPPLNFGVNSSEYDFNNDFDDLSSNLETLAEGSVPSPNGVVIAHSLIENPHDAAMSLIPSIEGVPAIKLHMAEMRFVENRRWFSDPTCSLQTLGWKDFYYSFSKRTISFKAFEYKDNEVGAELPRQGNKIEVGARQKVLIKWYFFPPNKFFLFSQEGRLPSACNNPINIKQCIGGDKSFGKLRFLDSPVLPSLECRWDGTSATVYTFPEMKFAFVSAHDSDKTISKIDEFSPETHFNFAVSVGGAEQSFAITTTEFLR